MALDFYYASGFPYAWRVWLALAHEGIAFGSPSRACFPPTSGSAQPSAG